MMAIEKRVALARLGQTRVECPGRFPVVASKKGGNTDGTTA
jgi:hypothetical protein